MLCTRLLMLYLGCVKALADPLELRQLLYNIRGHGRLTARSSLARPPKHRAVTSEATTGKVVLQVASQSLSVQYRWGKPSRRRHRSSPICMRATPDLLMKDLPSAFSEVPIWTLLLHGDDSSSLQRSN